MTSKLPIGVGKHRTYIELVGDQKLIEQVMARLNLDIRNVLVTIHQESLPSSPTKVKGCCGD